MDYRGEQDQEIEILESIYPDELEVLNEDRTKLVISIALDTEPEMEILGLRIEYPETYPEVIPIIGVEIQQSSGGIEPEDLAGLVQDLEETANENIGIQSVFTIASVLKDRAEQVIHSKKEHEHNKRLQEIQKQEQIEQAKFKGTPVTPSSFSTWLQGFKKTHASLFTNDIHWAKEKGNFPGKLTGRQIFEQGLAPDEDQDGEQEVVS